MQAEQFLLFPPFRLDPANERLWRGAQLLPLRPKPFAILRYLVEQRGRLVPKAELLKAVWPNTTVSEGVLKGYVRDLRAVLGDKAEAPRFIETVARRGYRFIVAVRSLESRVRSQNSEPTPSPQPPTPSLVGREAELAQLQAWLEKALRGERQIVFVTGEPGVGKTAVMEAFLEQVAANSGLWIGHGQCIEHYGAGEAYLPVLEALGRLCRESGGERLIELLGQYAPTWLVQMPALLSAADLEALQRKVQGATRERMLREMAEAVEALTAERGLVLRFEDLHWSDYSTLDLISYLARRRERARLLVLGTYRPADVIAREHPLKAVKQELQQHRHCEELPLGLLTEKAVAEYLAVRFAGGAHMPLRELARVIHQRTEGNPLFMVNIVEYFVGQGVMVEQEGKWELRVGVEEGDRAVPLSLRQMIEKQIERLSSEEQRVLEGASVAGMEFSTAAVAAGGEAEVGEIEERCVGLARREQFLRMRGVSEWPDGMVSGRYGFIHALYQNVLYERVTVGRRIGLHQRIGEREEEGHGERAGEIAAELAIHFERGRDYRRAVHYLRQAGENAVRRHAYREAIDHLTKGLELLKTLPDTPEHTQQELTLQIALGSALMATKGQGVPEVGKVYARARELCQRGGEPSQLFTVLRGLRFFYLGRGELQTAHELAEQLLTLAQNVQDPILLLLAHQALGATWYFLGEFAPAREHLEQGIALSDPQQHRPYALLYGEDPEVFCQVFAGLTLWVLGYPDQALQKCHEALNLAQEVSHPLSLAYALYHAGWLYQFRREGQRARERAEAVITLSTEQGFPLWLAQGTILRGWALAEQRQAEEGIAQMRQGLAAWRAAREELLQPYFLALLAEAYGKVGQVEEGLTLLAEALAIAHKNGDRFYEAELYRLKGTLTLQSKVQSSRSKVEEEAEECFWHAIEIAQRQSAKALELRIVMSLSQLWQSQGKKEEARQMLAEIYGWFTEGFDTADLKEAQALLAELEGRPNVTRREKCKSGGKRSVRKTRPSPRVSY